MNAIDGQSRYASETGRPRSGRPSWLASLPSSKEAARSISVLTMVRVSGLNAVTDATADSSRGSPGGY